jgi:hypothetical protein
MMKSIPVLFLFLVFFSCNNQSREPVRIEPIETVEEEDVEPSLDLSKKFPELNAFIREWDSSFSPGKFSQEEEIQLDSISWNTLDQETMEEFSPYFVMNADSTMALDLVSYNFIITNKNGAQRVEFAGPDTEIGLIDLKKNKRKRILFLGSSGFVLDGKWDEKGNIILAGAQDAGQGNLQPLIWRIYPAENKMETFSYPGTIKANISEYYKQKYKPFKTSRVV